jgi:hypothetical protein
MNWTSRRAAAAIAAVLLACLAAAQESAAPACPPHPGARGIVVGVPKAFDNRTLNIMLDSLNDSLSRLNFLDRKTILDAVGAVQGSSTSESANAFTIQGNPTPSITSSTGATPGTTVTTPSVTPAIPWSSDMATIPSALSDMQYKMGSSDILSEQMDLTYQLFNIRMLLDRSLSDRLLWNANGVSNRLQTVIGVNVSIDPPRDAENAAAVVEVTLYFEGGKYTGAQRPSLVAVMPQEHTYNAAALSSKANAFGGAAVVKMLSVGFSARRRGQVFYLFHDNDTVSFERPTDVNQGTMTFGWAFRPVLGRKSVSPGSRQMFAVVSLPKSDEDGTANPVILKADVHAYWRKYDPKTLTTANSREIRPLDKLAHVLSLGTRLTYPPGGRTEMCEYPIEVPLTGSYVEALTPEVTSVTWQPIGAKRAVVSVRGRNLFQGTKVAIGDKVYDGTSPGLRLMSDQGLDFQTDLDALGSEGSILGRYGTSVPLRQPGSEDDPQLQLVGGEISPALGGYAEIRASLMRGDDCLAPDDLQPASLGLPIVMLNGKTVPGPYVFPADGDGCAGILARIPESMFKDMSGVVSVSFPFRGARNTASFRSFDPELKYTAIVSVPGKEYYIKRGDGRPFISEENESAASWRVLVNGESLPLLGECKPPPADQKKKATAKSGKKPAAQKKTVDTPPEKSSFCLPTPQDNYARLRIAGAPPKVVVLLVHSKLGDSSSLVKLPDDKPPAAVPKLAKDQKGAVTQFDSVWLAFTGSNLTETGSVTAGSRILQFQADAGDSIKVYIPREATAQAGLLDITFLDKKSTPFGTARIAIATRKSTTVRSNP